MKKVENNDIEESKFMQLWHNKRTHAAMVLGLWMIFLVFVMLIAFTGGDNSEVDKFNSPTETETETVTFRDYTEMQQSLLKNNFNYEYNITNGDYKVIYKGEKLAEKETGYRENAKETIKYYVDETGFYKVSMDELLSLDKLYENISETLIDLELLFNTLNTQSVTTEEVEETRTFTYNYLVEDVTYKVMVYTNLDEISEINIEFEDKVYNLKFTNINKLESLSYTRAEVN